MSMKNSLSRHCFRTVPPALTRVTWDGTTMTDDVHFVPEKCVIFVLKRPTPDPLHRELLFEMVILRKVHLETGELGHPRTKVSRL